MEYGHRTISFKDFPLFFSISKALFSTFSSFLVQRRKKKISATFPRRPRNARLRWTRFFAHFRPNSPCTRLMQTPRECPAWNNRGKNPQLERRFFIFFSMSCEREEKKVSDWTDHGWTDRAKKGKKEKVKKSISICLSVCLFMSIESKSIDVQIDFLLDWSWWINVLWAIQTLILRWSLNGKKNLQGLWREKNLLLLLLLQITMDVVKTPRGICRAFLIRLCTYNYSRRLII